MGEVIVSMKDIVKTFPGVKALDHVNFELRSGEVMALLGENGAGKSTLMKILSGVYTKDSGTMTIFGTEYDNLTPKQAQAVGVAIIHQELNMCRHLSVAENMFLGREKVNGIVLNDREMEAEAAKILGDLKIDIDPRQTVGDLPVSKQQMVEIAKALSIHAKILIMDEPTSSLTAKEIEELFRIIRQLKADGCGIVYISHRLEELKAIVDECAKEACAYQIQYTREQCDSALKKWVDNYGIEVYEMTAENADLFRQKIQPVYDKFSAYNELIDLLK